MSKFDYGPDSPAIQELRGSYLIPVDVEPYPVTLPDDSVQIHYRAYQVWAGAITELELDKAFGNLKAQYPADYRNAALYLVRKRRDRLLLESDWTQVSDAPVDHEVWAAYRQALRDITDTEDPFNIEWPVTP